MTTPARSVLEDVPRVGFYGVMRQHEPDRGPEDFIYPSCMRAVMEYLDRPEHDYVHFMGVTGLGFGLHWSDGWHKVGPPPADARIREFEHAFDSSGYAFEVAGLTGDDAINKTKAKRRIIASINAGRPVLAYGVVGPEMSLIAGYDERGEVLIGWSFYQYGDAFTNGLDFEPNGMFRKRDWFPETRDLLILGERSEPMAPKAVLRRSLERAVETARVPDGWGGMHYGLAAYDAWVEHLRRDEDITPDGTPPEEGKEVPYIAHYARVGDVAEARWYAGRYLARIAKHEPKMASHLYEAAACYARIHELMWNIWACCGGNGVSPEHFRRFADPEVRREIIPLLQGARRLDEQAIKHIEAALRAVGIEPPSVPQAKAEQQTDAITPRFVEREAFDVVGLQAWLDMKHNEDPGYVLVNELPPHEDQIRALAATPGWYAVYHARRADSKVGCLVGADAGRNPTVPDGLEKVTIPAARYAVFECNADEMGKTWGYIHGQWFPQSDEHRLGATPPFEFYYPPVDGEAKGRRAIWVPVVAKRAANSKE